MIASSLKTGSIYKENDQPYLVIKFEIAKTAKRGSTVTIRARNLISGQIIDKKYQGTAKVEFTDIARKNVQYIYQDNGYVFMDPDTYEQFTLSADLVGDSARFLKEGESVQIMYFEDKPVSIELPNSMVFEITETVPGFKGNTISNVYKDATLNNGTVVKVPTFIKVGDIIKIDTRSGEYISRA